MKNSSANLTRTGMAVLWVVMFFGTSALPALAADHRKATGASERPRRTIECMAADSRVIKPLSEIQLTKSPPKGALPIDCSNNLFDGPPVVADVNAATLGHTPAAFHWVASDLSYQPPYFDDVPLERYGQSVCPALQPVLSGAHFFGQFAIIPYKMGIDRTHDPIYTLGYHRIGTDAPPVRQRLPFEWDAALFEAGAWTGFVFILP